MPIERGKGMKRVPLWISEEQYFSIFKLTDRRKETIASFIRRAIEGQIQKETPELQVTPVYVQEAPEH